MRVGYIGLGKLGHAQATRLRARGVDLTVWDRRRDRLGDLDARFAETAAELVEGSDVVFMCLTDSAAVAELAIGACGLLAGELEGTVFVDCTTNHFDSVVGFHEVFADAGASYVEAPVLGSVVPALEGRLTVLANGDSDALATVAPLLETIGRKVYVLPERGQPTKMKLVANLVLGVFMAGIAEAVGLGEASGVERDTVLDILAEGPGESMVLSAKRQKIASDDYEPHFSAALIYKDLGYMGDLARSLRKPLFTGAVARELYALTFERGLADRDLSVLARVVRDL